MPTFKLPLREPSDRDLIAAAERGDAEAFAAFYRRYCNLVLAYAVRRMPAPELAADLMMEVFAAALIAVRRQGASRVDDPAAWLFGIARNKLVDAYRRGGNEDAARRQLELEPMVLDDDDVARIDELAGEHRVAELLELLPGDQREAVRARILEDRSYDDIARELECSPLVVRQRVSRGLRRLRARLEDTP
ncbi:MAG TPA: sigma-70 family RNA polymerase sigma factor [Baekduia sp.]|nr:sigma-70 family RNA polymerase sigma factor [Baekduia sp.]